VLDQLRADRKMVVAETLTETRVAGSEGGELVLEPHNEHASATIERYRAAIEAAAGKVMGGVVKVRMTSEERRPETGDRIPARAAPPSGPPENAPLPDAPPVSGLRSPVSEKKPERLSVSGARAERAKSLRGKDPALDSAIDALDLELLD
jgi:hypothetical protein